MKFAYDLDGRAHTRTAQKASGETANVITYDYDTTFRRLSAERVTTPGTGVDQTVLSISHTYDSLGRPEFITSHNSATPDTSTFADAVNQVQYTYNAFGALDKEYQEHEGKVDGSSLHVDYAYDDATGTYNGISSVFTKGMRAKSVKYPNGRLVHYTYGTGGGLDDLLSRVAAIYNDNGGSPGSTAYAAYKYAGDGRIVQEALAEPDLKLTYIGAGSGDYSGFDRFGRVVWQRWLKTNGSAADRYFYGYDPASRLSRYARAGRNSNRRWRAERSNASSAAGQRDEAYAYDRLNRLVGTKRGILPSGTYQAPYPGDVTGNGVVDGSDSSVITANLGNSSRRWASGDLDGNGLVNSDDSAIYTANTGTPTQTVAAGRAWTLDATGNWQEYKEDNNGDGDYSDDADLDQNRTHNKANEIYNSTSGAAITETSGQSAWADPAYDARGNMTSAPKPSAMTGLYTCVYDAWNRLAEVQAGEVTIAKYRYDGTGRRVKSHIDSQAPGSPDGVDAYRHFYYNAGWQLLETRKSSVESTAPDTLNPECQYVWSLRYIDAPVLRDENKNSDTDCTDAEGDERLYYCTDAQMNVTAVIKPDGTVAERYTYDPYGKVTFKAADWSDAANQAKSAYDNEILYCGYRWDPESGLYHVRRRYLTPPLGRWMTNDPIGYADGMNLYQYVKNAPAIAVDPMGTYYNEPPGAQPHPRFAIPSPPPFPENDLDEIRQREERRQKIDREIDQIQLFGPMTGAKPEACRCNVDLSTFRIVEERYESVGISSQRKHIKFEFKVKADPDGKKHPKNCELVNWRNGGAWNLDGTTRDIWNYLEYSPNDTRGNWWVDSVDRDPRWGSVRSPLFSGPQPMGFTEDGGWALDEPTLSAQGLYQTKFRMCIYHHDDVPEEVYGNAHIGGWIFSKAIKCIDWETSILFKGNVTTHPAFWHPLSGRK